MIPRKQTGRTCLDPHIDDFIYYQSCVCVSLFETLCTKKKLCNMNYTFHDWLLEVCEKGAHLEGLLEDMQQADIYFSLQESKLLDALLSWRFSAASLSLL